MKKSVLGMYLSKFSLPEFLHVSEVIMGEVHYRKILLPAVRHAVPSCAHTPCNSRTACTTADLGDDIRHGVHGRAAQTLDAERVQGFADCPGIGVRRWWRWGTAAAPSTTSSSSSDHLLAGGDWGLEDRVWREVDHERSGVG